MEPLSHGLHSQQVDELPEYRSVSGTAIVGLLLALLSPLALVRPILIAIPIAAAIVCIVALLRIRAAEGSRVGKTPAVIGLGLACLFASAAPAKIVAFNRSLHARATPIAMTWLEALQRGEPHIAHQLTRPDLTRIPLNNDLWAFYVRDEAAGRELQEFVKDPAIHFLLTLGEDAQIRFYQPFTVEKMTSTSHLVSQLFAITYDDPSDGRTTFFLAVALERRQGAGESGEQWRVMNTEVSSRPAGV